METAELETLNDVIQLENRLYQEWLEESYGIINLTHNNDESSFNLVQDGIVYFGYQNPTGSKIVLVSRKEVLINNPSQDFEFIGCAWYGPNMRIAKFSKPIGSLNLAREIAQRMML